MIKQAKMDLEFLIKIGWGYIFPVHMDMHSNRAQTNL
jgi:hypothetical protein